LAAVLAQCDSKKGGKNDVKPQNKQKKNSIFHMNKKDQLVAQEPEYMQVVEHVVEPMCPSGQSAVDEQLAAQWPDWHLPLSPANSEEQAVPSALEEHVLLLVK
jgi:hypothetical protein